MNNDAIALLASMIFAGAVAVFLIGAVCKTANYVKSRFVKPFVLPPEGEVPAFQLRVSELLIGSLLYGIALVSISALFGLSSPEQMLPWALYFFTGFAGALFATGDLCRGDENRFPRSVVFGVFILSCIFILPFGLLAWWVWRRWQRVQRALKRLERTTLS